jgi:hypothetical protein
LGFLVQLSRLLMAATLPFRAAYPTVKARGMQISK